MVVERRTSPGRDVIGSFYRDEKVYRVAWDDGDTTGHIQVSALIPHSFLCEFQRID